MSKQRSVSTSFWSDPFIEELNTAEKLLYVYLITNGKTNMLGIYEVSIKKISFETGIDNETVSKALKGFERVQKVKRVDNYIILVNFLKHQNFNTNMKKSAIDTYNALPKSLKIKGVVIDKDNPLEGFETLSNHYGMVPKVEVEDESESEDESEEEEETETLAEGVEQVQQADIIRTPFEDFWNLYDKKNGNRKSCIQKWDKYPPTLKGLIMTHVKEYVKSTPEKQYRKNPESYLNQGHWNNEILKPEAKAPPSQKSFPTNRP